MIPDPEHKLDQLFKAYRQACADFEPSADFMPVLWAKIEAAGTMSWLVPMRIWATRLAAAASLAAAVLIVSLGFMQRAPEDLLEAGYIDVLVEDAVLASDGDLWLLGENRQ